MDPAPTPDADFWKRKLAAFLHDPPSKALDIKTHSERADAAFHRAGFTAEEVGKYFKGADHTAAADRLPWPQWRSANLACAFDGVRNAFLHPLGQPGGEPLRLPFQREFPSAELGIEGENSVQPLLTDESLAKLADEAERWRARFFAHWRLWPKHAAEKDYRLALLPADTRIPDHSIWTHMQVVSALGGCEQEGQLRPAFLKFQLGPVQDFIAAARSIRDLWSGSYLLSWLMAAGMKALSAEVGPDAVIFPNLRGQPLFDLHCREDLWSKVRIGSQTVWESLDWEDRALLTPNLPNVFLAVVPADQAAKLGRKITGAIQAEWKRIADAVWAACDAAGLTADEGGITRDERKARFNAQITRFLSLSWQATPWPETLGDALQLAEGFESEMPIWQARQHVQAVVDMAEKHMPADHRDGRYYAGGKDGPKTQLNNVGLGWPVILALNSWQLDAVRQTRDFRAANPGGWQAGAFNNKDALTGREEAVAGGRTWSGRAVKHAEKHNGPWKSLFKHDDWLGAATLVKRLWHFAYLEQKPWSLKTRADHFPMPNTRGVAAHVPQEDCGDDETADDAPPSEKYFAVLAFDGDEIGKWISGEKTPPFSSQLAEYRDGSGNRTGAREYFERASDPDGQGPLKSRYEKFLNARRPLSPSYHLQFSDALSNFALLCARPVVEAFDGRLIYAGGDDVVALLPADTALSCTEALRMAFQGDSQIKELLKEYSKRLVQPHETKQERDPKALPTPYFQKLAAEGCLLDAAAPGFLCRLDHVDQQNRPIPFLVPGPAASASVGVAIAHFKTPLQDVVRAARDAEDRAKKQLGRSAVAVTLMKRSGEILEWGCQWQSGGLELYRAIADALDVGQLSGKFPHRLCELLEPYVTGDADKLGSLKPAESFTPEMAQEVICCELDVVLSRQRGPKYERCVADAIRPLAAAYLARFDTAQGKVRALIGLCQAVAFAHRSRSENETPKGN